MVNEMDDEMYYVIYRNRVIRLAERFEEGGYALVAIDPSPYGLAFEFKQYSKNLGYVFAIPDIDFFTSAPLGEFEQWLDAAYEQCLESEVQNGKRE